MDKERLIKCATIFIAWIEMIFFGGIIFGINSVFPVLKKEKLFFEYCNTTNSSTINGTEACAQQNKMFGYILVTAVTFQCLVALPLGIFFDKFGQKWTKLLAGLSFLLGCVFFFFFPRSSALIYLFAACLSISTQCLLICNLSLAKLFPSYQNRIVSVLSGSIDSSSVVFIFVSMSYLAGANLFSSILALGFSGCAIMMFSAFVLLGTLGRERSEKGKERLGHSVSDSDKEEKAEELCLNNAEDLPEEPKNINGLLGNDYLTADSTENYNARLQNDLLKRYPTIFKALLSRQYLCQLIFFTIVFFRFSFILAQLSLQMGHHFPKQEDKIDRLLYESSFFLLCGVLISPFAGLIIDCFKQRLMKRSDDTARSGFDLYNETLKCFVLPLIICGTSNFLMSIFIMVPNGWAVYLTYALITITRSFLFSINSGFLLQAFPGKYFGKLLGGAILFSGVISFIQYALLFEAPHHLRTVNIVLIVVSCLSFVHPLFLCCRPSRSK